MNTQGENDYYQLMSGDRINFKTNETKEVEYDFQITPEILEQFKNWKLDILETTDNEPTSLEILNYFKNLGLLGFHGGLSPKVEIVSMEIIQEEDDS